MLEIGLLQSARAKNVPELIQPDFLAHIELNEDQDGPTQGRLDHDLRQAVADDGIKKDFGI
jgi:hypothetical protein